MIIFASVFGALLGFISIQPDPSGNIYFVLPGNLFSSISNAFSEFIQTVYNSFSEYFSLLPARLELNFLGFIWYLFLDLIGIVLFIGLFASIYLFLSDYIKQKKLIRILIDIIIGLIIGLIIGSVIGIIIKPYTKIIIWGILGFLLLIYLAIRWFVRNA